jgi:hypothetical protein
MFFPWYIEERNVLKCKKPLILDEFEKTLKQTYNLTDDQINWRRQKIHDANALGREGHKLFDQENPTTIE